VPATPVLAFSGRPRDAAADRPRIAPHQVQPAEADLAAIDAAAYGFDRAVDHAYWERHARRTTWPGAYSYVFPGGDIGPIAGRDPLAAASALAGELERAAGEVRVRIPGAARAPVGGGVRAGRR